MAYNYDFRYAFLLQKALLICKQKGTHDHYLYHMLLRDFVVWSNFHAFKYNYKSYSKIEEEWVKGKSVAIKMKSTLPSGLIHFTHVITSEIHVAIFMIICSWLHYCQFCSNCIQLQHYLQEWSHQSWVAWGSCVCKGWVCDLRCLLWYYNIFLNMTFKYD